MSSSSPTLEIPVRETARGSGERTFARACKIILVIWLLGIYLPYNLFLDPEKRAGMTDNWTLRFPSADFSQYYIAGTAARYGMWSDLYPSFRNDITWGTRRIYSSGDANASPALIAKMPYLPNWYVENIAPPPQALLCLPLAYFSYHTGYLIWITVLLLATVGALFTMSALSRRLGGISGYVEGGLFLLGGFIPLSPHIGGADNSMMILVFCCGIAALSWTDRRPFALGTSLVIPALFKGLTATWCPLLLVRPIKWRTLAWMAFLTLALNGTVVLLGGIGPYQTWVRDILPYAQDMELQVNWDHCVNLKGMAHSWGWIGFPGWAMTVLNLLGLAAVYFGFWKQSRPQTAPDLADVCAAMVAILVLFVFFNAISWMYYVLFLLPFAGWALIEYRQCSPTFQSRWKIIAVLVLVMVPLLHLGESRLVVLGSSAGANLARDFYFGVEVLFLVLAYRRLWADRPSPA